MELILFGLFSSFVAPFLYFSAKVLAERLFSEKQKSLPNPSANVLVVVIFVVV